MYVQNLRTGKKISPEPHGKESVLFDGRKLQYITAERPIFKNGTRYQQQNFGSFGFTNVAGLVSGEGAKVLGALSHRVKLEMQKSEANKPVGNLMVSTSRVSSSGLGFQAGWHHCHP
jgi:hypothetical protein